MTTRIRTSGRKPLRERAGVRGSRSLRAHATAFGTLAVLVAVLWSVPARQDAGPVPLVPVSDVVAFAPSQGDPGAPEPVVPQPPPVSSPDAAQAPVVAPGPVPDPGPPPLYPPELSGGPGLVPPGMSGPGGTTPLSGQGNDGLSASQPALVAPIEQPQPSGPEPGMSPFTVPGATPAGVAPFALPGAAQPGLAPFAQTPFSPKPVDPATAPSACPDDVAPGEILPPAIWSVCPGEQPQGWSYSPFLPYPAPQQPSAGALWVPGALQIQIPYVTGFGTDQAQKTLTTSGLNVGSVTGEPSGSPPGTVLRTDPPFGSAVEFGRAVNIVVAGR